MSRKNNPIQFPTIVSGNMALASITSDVSSIRFLDNAGYQFNFSGSPTGEIAIQVSADHEQDTSGNVTVAGNWVPLIFTYWNGSIFVTARAIPTSVGSPIYLDLTLLSAPWIRAVYTNTVAGLADISTVADIAGSLNSTYFLIDGADGDDWYVWLDNGTGVDPAVPNRTGIQVTYTDGDSANTLATLIRAALAACTSIETIGGGTNHVTFAQTDIGVGSIADGADPTGFTFGYTAPSGTLNAFFVAKMV